MRWGRVVPILVLVAVLAVAALYVTQTFPFAKKSGAAAKLAPDFTLTDIYGHDFTLSNYRSHNVVVIEFTALSCSECQIVMQSLRSMYSAYNQSGASPVQMVSVYIEPQFGDTVPALKDYHGKNNITWTMARDTSSLKVTNLYGVTAIPVVVVVDKQGHPVYDETGGDTSRLQPTVSSALGGTAQAISIVTVSVFLLAAIAGISTFFSPCAFPMFPGYMSLFLGLNASTAEARASSGGSYKGAVRRALSAGSVTALGMLIVFLVIGVGLILAESLVSKYIPKFLIVVAVVLIVLGFFLLTNLQYWRIVTPLQRLWQRVTGREPTAPVVGSAPLEGRGLYLKLFSYGMGYAAAAAGCVAPVIFAAIIAGLALGLFGGIVNILIYSLTAALLMISVTVALAVAGQRYVNQLKAYTPVIKKLSAVALIIVGSYLVYYYYTAWVV